MATPLEFTEKVRRPLGPLLFLLILSRIDIGDVMDTLRTVRLPFLALALLLYPLLVLLKAWRWHMLLQQQGIEYGLPSAFLAYNSSLAVGYVTPGRLGEFVKALYLRNDLGLTTGRAFSSVLLDRLLDLYALLLTALAGIAVFTMPQSLVALVVPVLVATGLGPLLILVPGISRRLTALVARAATCFVPAQHRGDIALSFSGFQTGMEELLDVRLLLPLALTVIGYVVFYGQCYLLAESLELPISYGFAAFCVSLGSLMALLPVSISGLGVRDLTFIAILGTAGLAPEVAISYSLLFLFVFNVLGGAIGALTWWMKPLR